MFPAPPRTDDLSVAELTQIMRWYADMGVDIVLDEAPHDRFADSAVELAAPETASPPREPPQRPQAAAPQRLPEIAPARAAPAAAQRPSMPAAAALSQEAATSMARETAAAARTLDELRAALETFEGCSLRSRASRLVFSDGDPAAKVMLVGDVPRADEDRDGRPFVGRHGQLLDRMLAAIGLDRTQVYIANVLPWRPPGGGKPKPQEIAICEFFIRRQIALANPDILVTLGALSAEALLNARQAITSVRGGWFDFTLERDDGVRTIKALATLHPDFLLRSPIFKREAWQDLRALRKKIDALL